MRESFLSRLATLYASARGIGVARVGVLAVNDGKFFSRIERGGSCTLRTADRVLRWFSDHWPEHLEWPPDIPRPEPAREEEREAA